MKNLKKALLNRELLPVYLIISITVIFAWKVFLKGMVLLPADITVGMYHPWLDHIWKGFVAGVPWKNGMFSDPVSSLYPWKTYAIDLIKNGQVPLWNSLTHCGEPLLANFESNIFNPLNFLFIIFNNYTAWNLEIMSTLIFAGIFCYLYLKNLNLSKFACLIGSIAFMFNGVFMSKLELGIETRTEMYIPLLFLLADKIITEKKLRFPLFAVIALTLQSLGGYPQISIYIFIIFIIYGLYRIYYYKKLLSVKTGIIKAITIISAAPLSLSLAAIQYLPGLELYINSIRQHDTMTVSQIVMPWSRIITLLAPDFFGNPTTRNTWGGLYYFDSAQYIGALPLILALFSIIFIKERFVKFLTLLTLFVYSFILPTPWAIFLTNAKIPFYANTSPSRLLIFITFFLIILAAIGLDYLERSKIKFWNFKHTVILITALFFCFLVPVFLSKFLIYRFAIDPKTGAIIKDIQKDIWYYDIAIRNSLLPFLLASAGLVTVYLLQKLKNKTITKCLILFLVTFDLLRFAWKLTPFSDSDFVYPKTTVTDFLSSQGKPFRTVGVIPTNMTVPYRIATAEGINPLGIERYNQFFNALSSKKPTTTTRYLNVSNDPKLLDLINVKYNLFLTVKDDNGVIDKGVKLPGERFKLVFQYGQTQVYENIKALPRAFLVYDYAVEKNDQKIIDLLNDKNFDFSKKIVLEKDLNKKFQPQNNKVDIIESEGSEFNLNVESNSDGLLFISDVYYPGWVALVDGIKTPIYRADYAFRAIEVPKGIHKVNFSYEPLSVKIGLFISVASLLFILWFAAAKKNKL